MSDRPRPQVDEDEVSLKEVFGFFGSLFKSAWSAAVSFIQKILIWLFSPFLKKRFLFPVLGIVLIVFSGSLVWKLVFEKKSYRVTIRMASNWDNEKVKQFSDSLFYPENMQKLMELVSVQDRDLTVFTAGLENPYPYQVLSETNIITNEQGKNFLVLTNVETKVLKTDITRDSGLFIEPYPDPLQIKEIHLSLRKLDADSMRKMINPLKSVVSNTMNTMSFYFFFRELAFTNADRIQQISSQFYEIKTKIVQQQKYLSDLKKTKATYGDVYGFDSVFKMKSLYVENMDMTGAERILNLPLTARIANIEQGIAKDESQLKYNIHILQYDQALLRIAQELNRKQNFDAVTIQQVVDKYTPVAIKKTVSDFINASVQNIKLRDSATFLSHQEIPVEMKKHTLHFVFWMTLKAFGIAVALIWLLKFFRHFFVWLEKNQDDE